MFEALRRNGEDELERSLRALWFCGIAAGIPISSLLLREALLRTYLHDAERRYIVKNMGYSFGFLPVILGRMQLLIETAITTVVPVVVKPRLGSAHGMARLWGVVLGASVIGAFAVARFLY